MKISHLCHVCQGGVAILFHFEAVPPLQNRFFSDIEAACKFPTTEVSFLWCEKCQHISINKTRTIKFDQNYDNRQTTSPFALEQYRSIVSDIKQQIPYRNACIIEIGCGRGELLEMLHFAEHTNLKGFDPAAPATPATTDMISNSYWDGTVQKRGADLIIARHTIEAIPEPMDFIGFIAEALKHDGRIYCEITNAPNLLNNRDIFSLYPEYSNLFSALSLARIYAENGLSVEKVTSINQGEWLGVWGKKNSGLYNYNAASHLAVLHEELLKLPRPIVLWGGAE